MEQSNNVTVGPSWTYVYNGPTGTYFCNTPTGTYVYNGTTGFGPTSFRPLNNI